MMRVPPSPWLQLVVPLFTAALVFIPRTNRTLPGNPNFPPEPRRDERLIVVVVDGLSPANVAPEQMPFLHRHAASGAVVVPVTTCIANYSFPCLQTLFEGREIAYSTVPNNFRGASGGRGLFDAAARAGIEGALVGKRMFHAMYGTWVKTWIDPEPLGRSPLARDVATLESGLALVANHRMRLVVLYVAGTDYVTHLTNRNARAQYLQHFRLVDEHLGRLIAALDPGRDNLLVLGDHGHEPGGHTRESLAIFRGQRFDEVFAATERQPLEQRDLLYFLHYPLGLALPVSYEGALPRIAHERSNESVRNYGALQRRVILAAGHTGEALERRLDPRWTPPPAMTWRLVFDLLPLLAALFLWMLSTSDARVRDVKVPAACLVLSAAVWHAGGSWLWSAIALSFILIALRLFWRSRAEVVAAPAPVGKHWPEAIFFMMLLAAVTGRFTGALADSFGQHAWAGMSLMTVSIFAAALIATRLWSDRWTDLPTGVQMVCFMALPAGTRPIQGVANWVRWYLVAALIVVLAELAREPRQPLRDAARASAGAVGALAFGLALFLVPISASKSWTPFLDTLLKRPRASSIIVGIALLAWLTWRLPSGRGWFILTTLAAAAYGSWAGLPPQWMATLLAIIAFMGAWIEWYLPGRGVDEEALVVAGLLLAVLFYSFRGFLPLYLDFGFGLPLVQNVRPEYLWWVILTPLTFLKYAAGVIVLLVYYCCLRGRVAAARVLGCTAWFMNIKVLCVLVQVTLGMMALNDATYAWAVGDLVLAWATTAMLVVAVALLRSRVEPTTASPDGALSAAA